MRPTTTRGLRPWLPNVAPPGLAQIFSGAVTVFSGVVIDILRGCHRGYRLLFANAH